MFVDDPVGHARGLRRQLDQVERLAAVAREPGFDPRLVLKIRIEGKPPSDIEAIPGLTVISEENKTLVVAFADQGGLREFRDRLDLIQRGRTATRKDLLFAVKGVEGWTPEDRTGAALAVEGTPSAPRYRLDVELWPLYEGRPEQRQRFVESFSRRCRELGAEVLDQVVQDEVIVLRVDVDDAGKDAFLRSKDVRTVDLPPRFQLGIDLLRQPLGSFPPVPAPSSTAPVVGVLDSGVASNHPFLANAMGHAESFIATDGPEDQHGHGTMVSGLAVYGDVESASREGRFVPQLRLLSGKVLTGANTYDRRLIESQVSEAVELFWRDYGCRVFNVSFGDVRHPYAGGRARSLTAVFDGLARRYGVLFTVAAGNFQGGTQGPSDWRSEYPAYLLSDEARVLDPAPALNVLTVGGLAEHDVSRMARRFPRDPSFQPIARRDQPSPFTRRGPGIGGAIKPEVVEYGGNWEVDLRTSGARPGGNSVLGVMSLSRDFAAGGGLFSVDCGTSYAAPRVAHLAARLLSEYPTATANLLRALIVAHARVPPSTATVMNGDDKAVLMIAGYGRPNAERTLLSDERCVTLMAEDQIGEEETHFFEIPIPDDFVGVPNRRPRRITLAVSHMPTVRTTRADYRASKLLLKLVYSADFESVKAVFRKTAPEDREQLIPEPTKVEPGSSSRHRGTVQVVTWPIVQTDRRWSGRKVFAVVARQVPGWARGLAEREPYALVAVVQDESESEVRLLTQLRQRLRERVRIGA